MVYLIFFFFFSHVLRYKLGIELKITLFCNSVISFILSLVVCRIVNSLLKDVVGVLDFTHVSSACLNFYTYVDGLLFCQMLGHY
jgi:hypothetical protein